MTMAAFLYDDYYCHGIKSSFVGLYSDADEAREVIRGARYDKQNLEIMDLETGGIEKYLWKPLYNHDDRREEGEFLKHRWDKDAPELKIEWENGRLPSRLKMHYEAGEWVEESRFDG